MANPTVGIIGGGFVGNAVAYGLNQAEIDIKIYDVDKKKATDTFRDTVECADFIFVCVPTPMKNTGEIDLSIVDQVMYDIYANDIMDDTIVILKSTVVPGTCDNIAKKYPKLHLVYNPEFLTARKAKFDFINPGRIVLGGYAKYVVNVEILYRKRFAVPNFIKTDYVTAEFIKYLSNCYFATKIGFMNEMYQIAKELNADW